jgi:hypothetical protein
VPVGWASVRQCPLKADPCARALVSGSMAAASVVHAAARNNAEWCDALCRAHGITGHFDADSWTSPKRTPPFYPDAVTLDAGVLPAQVLAQIDEGAGCSVKDSFADLELIDEGFRVLFRGEWLLAKRDDAPQLPSRWRVVETREQLADWETARGASGSTSGLFRSSLLGTRRLRCWRGTTAKGSLPAQSSTEVRR